MLQPDVVASGPQTAPCRHGADADAAVVAVVLPAPVHGVQAVVFARTGAYERVVGPVVVEVTHVGMMVAGLERRPAHTPSAAAAVRGGNAASEIAARSRPMTVRAPCVEPGRFPGARTRR
ncbi:MAG: hypothetical protein ACPIOQ_45270 [Promethearchaeia archaeon]